MFKKIASIFTCGALLFIAGCGNWCGCCKPTPKKEATPHVEETKPTDQKPTDSKPEQPTPEETPHNAQPTLVEPKIVMPKDM